MASQECDEGGADGWEEKRESDRRMEWVTGGYRGTMWLRAYVMLLLVYEVAVVGEAVDVIVFGISVQAVLKIVVNEKKTVFVGSVRKGFRPTLPPHSTGTQTIHSRVFLKSRVKCSDV